MRCYGARPPSQRRASRFEMSPRELIDATLKQSGHGESKRSKPISGATSSRISAHRIISTACARRQEFHFKADWANPPFATRAGRGEMPRCRSLGGYREADEKHPFRLATSPSRSYLNTSFNERRIAGREGSHVMMHPEDAAPSIADGDA